MLLKPAEPAARTFVLVSVALTVQAAGSAPDAPQTFADSEVAGLPATRNRIVSTLPGVYVRPLIMASLPMAVSAAEPSSLVSARPTAPLDETRNRARYCAVDDVRRATR